jgi:molybdopterin-containing oxidoreductase family membrane subunit
LALKYNRTEGPYAWSYYALIFFNGLVPQILWVPKMRRNLLVLWLVSIGVSIGMWLERYVIIPISLTRDYIPSAYGYYSPTIWDWSMFLGTIGLFLFLMFLFIRFLPIINIYEMKELLHIQKHSNGHANGHAKELQPESGPKIGQPPASERDKEDPS